MSSHLQPPLWRRSAAGNIDSVLSPAPLRSATLHELLGAISHEIRAPLTLLRGEAALLRRRAAEASAVREASDAIDRQVSQIAAFLQDLVALAEEGDVVRQPPQHIALNDLLERARHALGELFDERLSRVTFSSAEPSAIIEGDPERLVHAFRGVLVTLANAAALRGDIVIRASIEGREAIISLASRGAQIAPDLLPTLFDPFVRALYGLRAEGVNLAAARRTVVLHGGLIRVRNTDDGTEFVVRLPRVVR